MCQPMVQNVPTEGVFCAMELAHNVPCLGTFCTMTDVLLVLATILEYPS